MKYQVRIGARTIDVELDGARAIVAGVAHEAELRRLEGTPLRLLLLDGRASVFAIDPGGRGAWVLEEGGERHEVEVLDERTAHIRSIVGSNGARQGPAVLKAPMPGLVIRVQAEPGAAVAAGQSLVVLEAMKMENDLKATGPATIATVLVAPGQAVEKGEVLLTFVEVATAPPR